MLRQRLPSEIERDHGLALISCPWGLLYPFRRHTFM